MANIFSTFFAARDAFNDHFDGCRTCGTNGGRLCAAGSRLHTAYAALKNRIELSR